MIDGLPEINRFDGVKRMSCSGVSFLVPPMDFDASVKAMNAVLLGEPI